MPNREIEKNTNMNQKKKFHQQLNEKIIDKNQCLLKWLEEWYLNKCNGEWEHNYGITINTLDNPGRDISIDLIDTEVKLNDLKWQYFEKSEKDWFGYKIEKNVFNASGDPTKLTYLISLFKEKVMILD